MRWLCTLLRTLSSLVLIVTLRQELRPPGETDNLRISWRSTPRLPDQRISSGALSCGAEVVSRLDVSSGLWLGKVGCPTSGRCQGRVPWWEGISEGHVVHSSLRVGVAIGLGSLHSVLLGRSVGLRKVEPCLRT